jgi:signal transduction histidine kinase
MSMQAEKMVNATKLRRQAEACLKTLHRPPVPMQFQETRRLLSELQVHQVELEMQNEELQIKQANEGALRQIDTTIKAVRAIINDLRPAVLDLGLHAAVEWQAKNFERCSGIACEVHIDHEEFTIRDALATAMFRIVQESLTNIMRHAHASRAQIEILRKNNCISIRVADDGIGLPSDYARGTNAFGLIGIEERVHALGGIFSITSAPGKGMAIMLSMPI